VLYAYMSSSLLSVPPHITHNCKRENRKNESSRLSLCLVALLIVAGEDMRLVDLFVVDATRGLYERTDCRGTR